MPELIRRGRFPIPIDRVAVAADWRARGFSCDLFIDPPGRAWVDFTHSCDELVTVAEGRLELTVDGECLIAEPGDEVFIARGLRHSVRNIHTGSTRWLYGYDEVDG